MQARVSVSPSRFPHEACEEFKEKSREARASTDVTYSSTNQNTSLDTRKVDIVSSLSVLGLWRALTKQRGSNIAWSRCLPGSPYPPHLISSGHHAIPYQTADAAEHDGDGRVQFEPSLAGEASGQDRYPPGIAPKRGSGLKGLVDETDLEEPIHRREDLRLREHRRQKPRMDV